METLISALDSYKSLEKSNPPIYSVLKRLALIHPIELYAQSTFFISRQPPRIKEMPLKERRVIEKLIELDQFISTQIPKKGAQAQKEALLSAKQLGIETKKPHEIGNRLKEHVILFSIHILSGFLINPDLNDFDQVTTYLETALPNVDKTVLKEKIDAFKNTLEHYLLPDRTEEILSTMEEKLYATLSTIEQKDERPPEEPVFEPPLAPPQNPEASPKASREIFFKPAPIDPPEEGYDDIADLMLEITNGC